MKLTKEMLTEMVKEVIQEQMEEADPRKGIRKVYIAPSLDHQVHHVLDYIYTVKTGDMSARRALKRMKEDGLLTKEILNKIAHLSNTVFGDRSAEMSPMLNLQDMAVEEEKLAKTLNTASKIRKLIG